MRYGLSGEDSAWRMSLSKAYCGTIIPHYVEEQLALEHNPLQEINILI
jgi:hypothetical protein